MTRRFSFRSWATGAIVLAAVSACTNSTDSGHPSPSTAPSSFASASASAPSPTASAIADASRTVRSYFSVTDELGQDSTLPLSNLGRVATSVQLAAEQTLLQTQRQHGEHQVGSTAIISIETQSVNLNDSDPSAGDVPTVQVDVCWDVSKVDVVNVAGKSVVSRNRPDSGWTQLTVANYHYASDPSGGWRVATGKDLERKSCEPS